MYSLIRSMQLLVLFAAGIVFLPVCGADNAADNEFLKWKLKTFHDLESNLSRPVGERVQAVPDDMLKSLIDYDRSIGIRNTDYKARVPSADEMAMFTQYTKLLPARYQTTFADKLLVIYFIDNFAGAGLTDWVVDMEGEFHYFMILNSDLLTKSLDEWLTYRENSFFTQDSLFSIKVRTGTSYKALLYGFLHEGGHIVDIEYHVTPYLDEAHKKILKQESEISSFTRDMWEGQKKPIAKYVFNNRDKLNVYGIFNRELIPAGEMETMFLQLTRTPFVSFYAGTAWQEDFADLITYHHVDRNLGGSIGVGLYEGGKVIKKLSPTKRSMSGERKKIVRAFIK